MPEGISLAERGIEADAVGDVAGDKFYMAVGDDGFINPDIVSGAAPGRQSDDETILYVAPGIWGEYAAILPEAYRRARTAGLSTVIAGG